MPYPKIQNIHLKYCIIFHLILLAMQLNYQTIRKDFESNWTRYNYMECSFQSHFWGQSYETRES